MSFVNHDQVSIVRVVGRIVYVTRISLEMLGIFNSHGFTVIVK